MSFPQVKYPYNPKIVRGFFKDTPIRMSAQASQKRPHTRPFELPAASRAQRRTGKGKDVPLSIFVTRSPQPSYRWFRNRTQTIRQSCAKHHDRNGSGQAAWLARRNQETRPACAGASTFQCTSKSAAAAALSPFSRFWIARNVSQDYTSIVLNGQ